MDRTPAGLRGPVVIPLTDYALAWVEWVTRPLRAVDDARVIQDSEDDFEGKEETP